MPVDLLKNRLQSYTPIAAIEGKITRISGLVTIMDLNVVKAANVSNLFKNTGYDEKTNYDTQHQ